MDPVRSEGPVPESVLIPTVQPQQDLRGERRLLSLAARRGVLPLGTCSAQWGLGGLQEGEELERRRNGRSGLGGEGEKK